MSRVFDTDFLVIGSGIAGLYAATRLAASGEVTIVTKSEAHQSNTFYAQGGVASVMDSGDSFKQHIEDTMVAGAGLCNRKAVEVMVEEGPSDIEHLIDIGVAFDRHDDGSLDLAREAGHSVNRILHATDMTGRAIEETLLKEVQNQGIKLLERQVVVELITDFHLETQLSRSKTTTCYGAYVYDRTTMEINIIRARSVILATGGAGSIYQHNTNSRVATGDGVAIAYRAGAVISNMEFFQFHPTSLYSPGGKTILVSEALRGFGAVLRNMSEERFMDRYDARLELAPRDIVARAIDAELKREGSEHVWLDLTHKPAEEILSHFPNIHRLCLKRGIDITKDKIPVVPAAHYMCGGVKTDLAGRTNLSRLYAAGEVASTGVHGGNRLASNSLLEGLVFARRVAEQLKSEPDEPHQVEIRPWDNNGLTNAQEWILVRHDFEEIKHIMWDYVGIVRSNQRLNRALNRIKVLSAEVEDFYRRTRIQNKILELRNMVLVARLIVESALTRHESRGLHFNLDYEENREPTDINTNLQRAE